MNYWQFLVNKNCRQSMYLHYLTLGFLKQLHIICFFEMVQKRTVILSFPKNEIKSFHHATRDAQKGIENKNRDSSKPEACIVYNVDSILSKCWREIIATQHWGRGNGWKACQEANNKKIQWCIYISNAHTILEKCLKQICWKKMCGGIWVLCQVGFASMLTMRWVASVTFTAKYVSLCLLTSARS